MKIHKNVNNKFLNKMCIGQNQKQGTEIRIKKKIYINLQNLFFFF